MILIRNDATYLPSYMYYWSLDETLLLKYDSREKELIFLKQHLNEHIQPEHNQLIYRQAAYSYDFYNVVFGKMLVHTNQTEGSHIFQEVDGCELKDDGTHHGFSFNALDGESFVRYNRQEQQWHSTLKIADRTAHWWNLVDGAAQQCTLYLDDICQNFLTMILSYEKLNPEKEFIPNVKVYGRKSHNHTLISVSCHANGFYPYKITLDWFKNGNLRVNAFQSSGILPNGDGTYQITKTIKVTVDDENRYACQIDHESLEDGITVNWDGKIDDGDGGARGKYIMYIAIAIIVVVILILSAFLFRKKKADDALNGYCTT
ncbi:class I histocompatibility antigen, F10 alpha chain-like isoform X2 [Protopterus annectens]|nr:class I histocompatibility antigen, F10 alpha chain-like isoform X2 [Protopterus annectens]